MTRAAEVATVAARVFRDERGQPGRTLPGCAVMYASTVGNNAASSPRRRKTW